jgi:multiple antibiotic resistance protein
MEYMNSYINIVLSSLITLFPVVNPIGTAFILNPYFNDLSKSEQTKIASKIALYSFFVCLVTLLLGQYILEVFGISVPVVQFAGGIIICKIGWEFMSDAPQDSKIELKGANSLDSIKDKAFYPITFPITTGAGTISVLLTLTAHNKGITYLNSLISISAILISVLTICVLIFIFYSNTSRLLNRIGETEKNIVNKISAFLVFCVGLQIATTGISKLVKEFAK